MKKKYKYTAILTFVISLMMVVSVMFPMVTSAEDSMTSSTTDPTKTTETTDTKTEASTESSTDSSSKDSIDKVEDSADELVENESSPAFSSEKTVDGVKVKVTADANVFPEGTTMEVKKVSLTSSEKKLISAKQDSKQSTIKQYSFDITMKNKDGKEIEPDTSEGKVKVSFENDYVKMLSTDVYHFVSSSNVEELNLTKSKNTVTGETSSFSTYVIDFTYDSSEIYYLYDDSSVLASKLLAQLLSDDVSIDEAKITKVTSTKSYISTNQSDGKWSISADPNTTEDVSDGADVTITYDGQDYTINVKYTKTNTKDGTTDAWVKNFGYTKSGSTVTLTKFTGSVTTISIYPTAMINGTSYNVKVGAGLFSSTNITEVNFVGSSSTAVTASDSLMSFFYNCTSLKKVDLSGLDTSNVTDMTSFFNSCTSLTNDGKDSYIKFKNGDLAYFKTSKVKNMSYMFYKSGITKLDLSSFDTSSLVEMPIMFGDCSHLEELNLSSFKGAVSNYASYPDPSSVTPLSGCSNLTKITFGSSWHAADAKNYLPTGLSGYWKNTATSKVYTSNEIDTSYNGSTMAGTYTRVSVAGSSPQYEANGSLYGNNIWESHNPSQAFHGYCLNIQKHYPKGYYDKVQLNTYGNSQTSTDANGHSNYIGDYISANSGYQYIGGSNPTMAKALIALIYWSDDLIGQHKLTETEAQALIWLFTDQYDQISNKDYRNETGTISYKASTQTFSFYDIDENGNQTLNYTFDLNKYNYDTIPNASNYNLFIYAPASNNTENVQNLLSIKGATPDVRGGVQVKKVDQNGDPVAGATFGVYKKGEVASGKEIATFETNLNGYGGLYGMDASTGLPIGDYVVKELSAPNGYTINKTEYAFSVTKDDDQVVQLVGDGTGNNKTITDEKQSDYKGAGLQILKRDEDGNSLTGAQFKIYEKSDDASKQAEYKEKAKIYTTDSNGIIQTGSTELEVGKTYVIEEIKAPTGFEIAKISEFTVRDDEVNTYIVKTITDKAKKGTVNLSATKKLIGSDGKSVSLTAGQFTFGLYKSDGEAVKDENGKAITVTNDADGKISFTNVPVTANGSDSVTYYIKEIKPSDANDKIDYDTHSEKVVISIKDNGNTLTCTPTYERDGAIFTNTKNVSYIYGGKLTIKKKVTGAFVSSTDAFTFKVSIISPLSDLTDKLKDSSSQFKAVIKSTTDNSSESTDITDSFISSLVKTNTDANTNLTTYVGKIQLKKDQGCYLTGLPTKVGETSCRFKIEEEAYTYYNTTNKVTNGTNITASGERIAAGDLTSNETVVTYTNEGNFIVPTSADTLTRYPFWIAGALGALVIIYFKKRQKRKEK